MLVNRFIKNAFVFCCCFIFTIAALSQDVRSIRVISQVADEPPGRPKPPEYQIVFTPDANGAFRADFYHEDSRRIKLKSTSLVSKERIEKVSKWIHSNKAVFTKQDIGYSTADLVSRSPEFKLHFPIPDDMIVLPDSFQFCNQYKMERRISTGGVRTSVILDSTSGIRFTMDFADDNRFDVRNFLYAYTLLKECLPAAFPGSASFTRENLFHVLLTYQKTVECEGYYYRQFLARNPQMSAEDRRRMTGWNFSEELPRFLTVNQVRYHVIARGLASARAGIPAVVFENGLGNGLDTWDTVLDGIAQFAPVIAYDRAGVGKSGKANEKPTVERVAQNLKALLGELGIPPPYVLVGHSLGGLYIRGYAGLYPGDVEALVFIDPADFTETKAAWNSMLASLGVSEQRIEEISAARLSGPDNAETSSGPAGEALVLAELRRVDFEPVDRLPLPHVPIHFLIGGKFEVPPERQSKDFNQVEFFRVRTNLNMQRWREYIYRSRKGGTLQYLSESGHFLQRDNPQALIELLRQLVQRP